VTQETQVWKQASEVYEELSELTVKQAIAEVYGIKNLSIEVRNAVITLINSGQQASLYYQENIANKLNLMIRNSTKVGEKLGEYELLDVLGCGGMSQVFKARRVNSETQKLVAIKVFSPKEHSETLLDHFINEQKILAQFDHPYIVDMLHGGKTKEGIVYLVMELIEGAKPLDKYCQSQDLTVKEKISFIYQVAQALAYSHNNLIIHRDIKPDNILVNDKNQLKIVDFGIAKLINKDSTGYKSTLMALTPGYAAPEQINSQQITVKSDVFSLAIVALDLLIDKNSNPLPNDRMVKSCLSDQNQIESTLKHLQIDKDLKNILLKASQHEASNRYNNMHAFAEDLTNFLKDKPVSATSPSLFYRLHKFAKRRRALFASLASLSFTIALGFVVLTHQYRQTKVAEQKAIEVKNFMLDVFSYADPEVNIGQKLSALDLLSLADEEIKFKTFSDDVVKSDILANIGIAFVNLGGFEDGERNLLAALQFNPNNIASRLKLVQLYLDQSSPEKITKHLKIAEKIIDESPSDFALEKADLILLKAVNTTYSNDNELAIKRAKQAQEQFIKLNNYPGILKSTRVLTERMFNLSENTEAITIAIKILDALKKKVSPVNTELLRLKTSLTWMFTKLGRYNEAINTIDQVIENLRKTLGDKHPAILDALIQRANVYKSLGEITKAVADAQESYHLSQLTYGADSQYAQQSLSMLALLEFESGDRELALQHLQKALKMSEKNYGKNHRMTLNARIELSNYMAANGKLGAAIQNAKQTQKILNETLGEKHPQTLFGNNVLIKLLSQQAVNDEVIKMAIRHNKNTVEILGIKHPQSAYSFFVLGKIYAAANMFDKANEAYISLLENKLVLQNNPRFIPLTASIAENYSKIQKNELAIEYALKSYHATIKLFSKNSSRYLESKIKLAEILSDADDERARKHILELKKRVKSSSIDDPVLVSKIKKLSP